MSNLQITVSGILLSGYLLCVSGVWILANFGLAILVAGLILLLIGPMAFVVVNNC